MPDYLSGQPDKRKAMRFTDQHGRKWMGTIEIKSGLPTGALKPLDFSPPLLIPQQFFKFDPMEPNVVVINYAAWIKSLEDARRRWEQKLINRAQTLYGDQAGKYLKKPSRELLDAVGPEPLPVEPVQAAASGNKWVLGLSPIKPGWAEKFFPEDGPLTVERPTRAVRGLSDDALDAWAQQFPDEEVDEEE